MPITKYLRVVRYLGGRSLVTPLDCAKKRMICGQIRCHVSPSPIRCSPHRSLMRGLDTLADGLNNNTRVLLEYYLGTESAAWG